MVSKLVIVTGVFVAISSCSDGADYQQLTAAQNDSVILSEQAGPSIESGMAVVTNNGPEGSSGIVVDDRRYSLDAAIGDFWGISGEHYNVNFTLTNGNFRLQPTDIHGETHNILVPDQASAIIYAEMYYPGESFRFDYFEYFSESFVEDIEIDEAFFTNGYVAIDTDANGGLEAYERFAIVGGSISFIGLLPDLQLRFSVALANGQTAIGYYTGLFDITDRRALHTRN